MLHGDYSTPANTASPRSAKRLVLLGSRLGPIQLPIPLGGMLPTVRSAIGKLPKTQAGQSFAADPSIRLAH